MATRALPLGTALLLMGAACGSAHADRIAVEHKRPARVVADPSPYSVDLLDEHGRDLDVYRHGGRYYILGAAGQRYTIRVKNPTNRRVEAVVSVDGLDAIDGKVADFVNKRGYVVPPYGELRLDGFRVSQSHVATFRFSSVANSYAGRKGKARNVGVIGVAIFEEQRAPEVIVAPPPVGIRPQPQPRPRYDIDVDIDDADDVEYEKSEPAPNRGKAAKRRPAPPPAEPSADAPAAGGSAGAPAPRDFETSVTESRRCCGDNRPQPKQRPGLGTEFGERRYSSVSFTRFVRANARVPSAIAELRYNDRAGLVALGIRLAPDPDPHELHLRETASPFPASGFASPPNGWR